MGVPMNRPRSKLFLALYSDPAYLKSDVLQVLSKYIIPPLTFAKILAFSTFCAPRRS